MKNCSLDLQLQGTGAAGAPPSPGAASEELTYYASHGPISDPGPFSALLDALPQGIPDLVGTLLGLVLHPVAAARKGVALPDDRRAELDLRYVPRMLARLTELDARPLPECRPPERRLVGNCRDSAVLLCAVLRHQRRPARCRAGFATYLEPGYFTDHWVCEVWREDERRWAAVDPGFAPGAGFDFDTLDVPPDRFLSAGAAWRAHRAGRLDARRCGLVGNPESGPGWIASQAVRDLAALNKVELLCWDGWGLARTAFDHLAPEDLALLDRVAGATAGTTAARVAGRTPVALTPDGARAADVRRLYETESRLSVPREVRSLDHSRGGAPVIVPINLRGHD